MQLIKNPYELRVLVQALMDDLDLKILDALRLNSRRPLLEIARELGVSDVTVHSRVREMIQKGIIKGFTCIVDYESLGLHVTAFLEIKIEAGSLESVMSDLKQFSWITDIYEVQGEYNLLLKARARDLSDLRDKVELEISKIPHVISVHTTTVLKTRREWGHVQLTKSTAVRGASGAVHEFSDVIKNNSEVSKVVDYHNSKVKEVDVVHLYAKAFDVGATNLEIIAPSYTKKA